MTQVSLDRSTSEMFVRHAYTVSEAPDRPVPYSRADGIMYRPASLQLVLVVTTDGPVPDRSQVRLSRMTVFGYKLKKDGSPGLAECKESFYGTSDDRVPEWAAELLREAVDQVKAG